MLPPIILIKLFTYYNFARGQETVGIAKIYRLVISSCFSKKL